MKNTLKWFGIIALVLVIGMAVAGCDDSSDDGSGIDTALWDQVEGDWVKDIDSTDEIQVNFFLHEGDYFFYCFYESGNYMGGIIDSIKGGIVSLTEGTTFNVAVANGKLTISNWKGEANVNGVYSEDKRK
jgi:hypothetical protein